MGEDVAELSAEVEPMSVVEVETRPEVPVLPKSPGKYSRKK